MQVTRINGMITKRKNVLMVKQTCFDFEFSQLVTEERRIIYILISGVRVKPPADLLYDDKVLTFAVIPGFSPGFCLHIFTCN